MSDGLWFYASISRANYLLNKEDHAQNEYKVIKLDLKLGLNGAASELHINTLWL